MLSNMLYWLKGEPIQNFGDYLSEYFRAHLFYGEGLSAPNVRLIGSCIDDGLIDNQSPDDPFDYSTPADRHTKAIFWGCGLRYPDSLSVANRAVVEILSVRGPLTQSALRLGNMVPIGDPGLLLPALYDPRPAPSARGASIIVPHFYDQRSDEELLAITGCELVLRPNITNDLEAVERFVDHIAAAGFVLTGSMHAAVAAVAYRKPFGFWDSGNVDLPFKWQDFAASLSAPCNFFVDLKSAQRHYESALAPSIKLPILWPMLSVAPYPVRAAAFARVIRMDIELHGIEALQERASGSLENRLYDEQERRAGMIRQLALEARSKNAQIEELIHTLQQKDSSTVVLEDRLRQTTANISDLNLKLKLQEEKAQRSAADLLNSFERVEELTSTLVQRTDEIAVLTSKLQDQSSELADAHSRLSSQAAQVNDLNQRLQQLTSDRDGLRLGLQDTNAELEMLRSDIRSRINEIQDQQANERVLQKTIDQIISSKSWRITAPLRTLTLRHPKLGKHLARLLKLVWWTLTLQLFSKLKDKRWIRGQISCLKHTELLDKKWYLEKYPDVAQAGVSVAEHYFWCGVVEDADPHPLFDTSWYVQQYPEVTQTRLNPVVHYLRVGAAAGYDPHPLFDTSWYCEQYPEVKASGENPLVHYLRQGSKAGFNPNPWFDGQGYSIECPEVASLEGPPLLHYVLIGSNRNSDPHPFFDSRWYSVTYRDQLAGMEPLAHYLSAGIGLGYVPSPFLSSVRIESTGLPALALPICAHPDVSIIVPTYNKYFYTYRCLYSIMMYTGTAVKYEIIVADDCPDHEIGEALRGVPGLRVVMNQQNLGFLRNCNNASKLSTARYIVFLNNDTVVRENWLAHLLTMADSDPDIAIVGGKLLNQDGTIQEAGGIIFEDGWGYPYGAGDRSERGAYNYVRDVDCIIGACLLVRRSQFEAVGRFDESYAPAFYEEFDLAFALQEQGYRVVYQPACEVIHFGSQSYGGSVRDSLSLRNHNIFVEKWANRLSLQPDRRQSLFLARDRRRVRATILVVDDRVPQWDKHAGALTLYQYLQLLVAMGCRVVFCGVNLEPTEPYASVLQQLGIELIVRPDTLESWLEHNGKHLDYVWTARPDVSGHLLPVIRTHTTAKILYYTHDLHYLRELRRYMLDSDPWAIEESNRLKAIELEIFRSVDCVMTPSCEEVRIIRDAVPSANVREVLPYFYPNEASISGLGFSDRHEMVFVGGFAHIPNVDAAVWLVEEILPLVWKHMPEVRLLVIGSNPPAAVTRLATERVEVVGYVPEVEPYYERARVSINPLRYGAGVKGKIVASLKAGVPVVTTPIGNEGIGLRDGIDGFVAESAVELAERIVTLYRDDSLCSQFADSGRSFIRRQFSVTKARQILSEILAMDTCDAYGDDLKQQHLVP